MLTVREPQAEDALKYVRREMPGKLDAYHAEIEQALKADSHRTKQNRRTAKALLVQIRAQGYTGCYSHPFQRLCNDFTYSTGSNRNGSTLFGKKS